MSVSTPASVGSDSPPAEGALVSVRNLKKYFPITRGIIFQREIGRVQAVDDISFDIYPGETLGLVGESGCGKSTTARLVMKLLDATAGSVTFEGTDITKLSQRNMRPYRRQMQMVFQDPYASLNPRQTVGQIIGAPFSIHKTEGDTKRRVRELMDRTGLNPEHYNRYSHEFSGGQRQRIGVARALALSPKLIVCDEPVSALDVSIQAQILNLLEGLQEDFNLTYLFISHDLGVVRHVSDRIAVMYLGHIVEVADADSLYENPKHPYTAALLSAVPKGLTSDGPPPRSASFSRATSRLRSTRRQAARSILVARRREQVAGRDDEVPENCRSERPPLGEVEPRHRAACWYPLEKGEKLQQAARA